MTMKIMKKPVALVLAMTLVLSYPLVSLTETKVAAAAASDDYVWNTPFTNPYGTLKDQVEIYANPGVKDSCEPADGQNWSMISRAEWANYGQDQAGSNITSTNEGVEVKVNDYSALPSNQCATAVAGWMTPVSLDGAAIAFKNFSYNTSGAVGYPVLNMEYNIEPRFNHGYSYRVFGIRIFYNYPSGMAYLTLTTPERNEWTKPAGQAGANYSWNSPYYNIAANANICTLGSVQLDKNLTSLSSNIAAVKEGNDIVAYRVFLNGKLFATLCKNDGDVSQYTKGVAAWDLFKMLEDSKVNNKVYVMSGMYDSTYWTSNSYYQPGGKWDGSLRKNLCNFTITRLGDTYFGTDNKPATVDAKNYIWNTPFINPYGNTGDLVKINANPGVQDSCEPADSDSFSMVSRPEWNNWKLNQAGTTFKTTDAGVVVTAKDYSAIVPNDGNQCATVVASWMRPVNLDGASIGLKDFTYKTNAVGYPVLNIEYNIEPRYNHSLNYGAFGIRIFYNYPSGMCYVYLNTPERNEMTKESGVTYTAYSWNSPDFSQDIDPNVCKVYSAQLSEGMTAINSKVKAVKDKTGGIIAYQVYFNDVIVATFCKNKADVANYTNGFYAWDLFKMLEDTKVNNHVYSMAGLYDSTYWKNNPYYQTHTVWDLTKSSLRTDLCSFAITGANGKYFGNNKPESEDYEDVGTVTDTNDTAGSGGSDLTDTENNPDTSDSFPMKELGVLIASSALAAITLKKYGTARRILHR